MPSLFIFNIFSNWALFALRLALSFIFLSHGLPKIKNLSETAKNFSNMGFKPGKLWGTMVALLEFFGGTAFLIGFAVQPFAFFFVLEFIVINIWRIWRRHPFVGGWELDLLILGGVLALMTLGGGALALDLLIH